MNGTGREQDADFVAAKDRVAALRQLLEYHSRKYYVEDAPEISDYAYDRLFYECKTLEEQYPALADPNSPTKRVGGGALDKFTKVTHAVRMGSLGDVFSYDELRAALADIDRVLLANGRTPGYSVECKIDGLSVSLEYENGALVRASTRGDGLVGEDVTENIRTVRSVPLVILDAPKRLEVRGEVYLSRKHFARLNDQRLADGESLFANPRNAAAGTLRQLDSKITAKRGLDLFVFNIQAVDGVSYQSHIESLRAMEALGFPVIPRLTLCRTADEVIGQVEEIGAMRATLPFDIDGVVVKVDNLSDRVLVGENTATPKWAFAYKFPPEIQETTLRDISIQVGRTGVLSPVAELTPVMLAGSTVSRAMLHNIDFIRQRDIHIGDRVLVQKAGDIIPEVLRALPEKRTGAERVFEMPLVCPSCGEAVSRDEEAATRCTNGSCPAQLLRSLAHFVSRDAMNIDGLGMMLLRALRDAGLVHSAADLYALSATDIAALERMGEKSADNLMHAIEQSKSRGLDRLIYALGIRQVGQKTGQILAKTFHDVERFFTLTAEELQLLDDIGPQTAESIVRFFSHPQTRHLIDRLRASGVTLTYEDKTVSDIFHDMTFVLTGTLPTLDRASATTLIVQRGGRVSGSVSKKTSVVLAGEAAGSKLQKAQDLGIRVVDEAAFLAMIGDEKPIE